MTRALECGLWVHGEFLRKELLGERSDIIDVTGSELDITSFLGYYGEAPTDLCMIHGYLVRVHVSHVDFHWWFKTQRPVLSCDSFFRSRHIWLGSTRDAIEMVGITKRKRFKYIGLPFAEYGLEMVAKGWVPLNGPKSVMNAYLNRIKVILHLGLGLPLDLATKIVSHL